MGIRDLEVVTVLLVRVGQEDVPTLWELNGTMGVVGVVGVVEPVGAMDLKDPLAP